MKYIAVCICVFATIISYAQNIPIAPTSNHSGGSYRIYRSATNNAVAINALRKAIIWVERFEVSAPATIEDNYALMGASLATQLHAAGYNLLKMNCLQGISTVRKIFDHLTSRFY